MTANSNKDLFDSFKDGLLNLDPVAFCEKNLTIDGEPLRLSGSGYKPFSSIYRYIGSKALEPNSKPVVMVKGRQVGATTMAAALELYFMASGLFGANGKPPMRIMHAFPTLVHCFAYTKTKLNTMIALANPSDQLGKFSGKAKTVIEAKLDSNTSTNDSLQFKQFAGGNHIWIESTGVDGTRLTGRTVDAILYDECFPYNQNIETINGKVPIGELYDLYSQNKELPLVKTYNENTKSFEYKKILNAWNRGKRKLVRILCGKNIELLCTSNHRFLTIKGWKEASELIPGELLLTEEGVGINVDYDYFIHVEQVIYTSKEDEVYDIEVEDNHNFIVNGLIAHNCQDINPVAMGAAEKILSQAKYGRTGYGVQLLFGTPRRKGSGYHKIWQMSNQQYYHLGCERCEKYFPLYTPGSDEWESIWLYGFTVRCPHCHCEQNKNEAVERGRWIAASKEPDTKFIGYHINQLYIPTFSKEYIISAKPENHPTNTERLYMNEVLGEFFDGEGGPVSKDEIETACADRQRKMRASIAINEPRKVYLGCDWGGKDLLDEEGGSSKGGQSYSCVVVLSTEDGVRFSVDFAKRLMRNDPESKRGIVEQMFRQYSINTAVGDIGFANDLTYDLQKMFGDKFIASRVGAKVNKKIIYDPDTTDIKTIVFEKDHYLAEMFGMLKKGLIRFPYGSFEQISWLVDHCSSMEIKVVMRNGEPSLRYVKGGAPNDGLMALLNAYLAFLFDSTNAFTGKKGGILMPGEKKIPRISTIYAPNVR